jgi:hypothetical protein
MRISSGIPLHGIAALARFNLLRFAARTFIRAVLLAVGSGFPSPVFIRSLAVDPTRSEIV